MATVVWRRNRQVTIYYWDTNTKRLVSLPREQTKHLDGLPKEHVLRWKEEWERNNGKARARSARIHLVEKDQLSVLWRQYQIHRTKLKNRRESTANKETELFETHIVPFFIGVHQKKNPTDWHNLIPAFHDFLFQKSLQNTTIKKILGILERFGKYLVFKQYMIFPFVIQAPHRQNNKITPLKIELTPENIFKFTETNNEFNLAVLIGFFASLGPGELFALTREDFLTGQKAIQETKTYERFKEIGLGSKLSVIIDKTLSTNNQLILDTKNETRKSIVNIWNDTAAKKIAKILSEKPSGRLFTRSYSHLMHLWRKMVYPSLKVTPHDLRRAAALYLGRNLGINPLLLQEHMRHAEIETTMLYTRRPQATSVKNTDQDFDDV